MKILFLDDVEFTRLLIQKTLSRFGYVVVTASTCGEALNVLRQEPDIAVVVCDLMMPDMDGIDFLRQCQSELPSPGKLPPFLLLTALDNEECLNNARAAGYMDVIVKPVEPTQLSEKLQKVLSGT